MKTEKSNQTEIPSNSPAVDRSVDRPVGLFLAEIQELRVKINLRQSVTNAKPLFARVLATWNDPRFSPILGELQSQDVGGDYTIDRAKECIIAGLRFANSMSGHSFGWVDGGLEIIEHRLLNMPNAQGELPRPNQTTNKQKG